MTDFAKEVKAYLELQHYKHGNHAVAVVSSTGTKEFRAYLKFLKQILIIDQASTEKIQADVTQKIVKGVVFLFISDKHSGKILGHLVLWPFLSNGDKYVEISELYVARNARGNGLATYFIDITKQLALHVNASIVLQDVHDTSMPFLNAYRHKKIGCTTSAFYEKHGFEKIQNDYFTHYLSKEAVRKEFSAGSSHRLLRRNTI